MKRRFVSISPFGFCSLFFLAYACAILMFNGPVWSFLLICCLPLLALAIKYPRLLFYCLLVTIPPSVEFSVTDSLATDLPDEPLIALCCFFAITGLIWQHGSKEKSLAHTIAVLLVIQLAWLVIAVLNSVDLVVSAKFLAAKTWYLGAFLLFPILIFKREKHLRTAAWVFTVSMLVCIFWVLSRHALSGFSFSAINPSVQPLFRNHVNYSVLVVSIIPLVCAFAFSVKERGIKFLLIGLLLLLLAALYFTYSRGAWLALLTGAGALWLLKKRLLLFGYLAAVLLTLSGFFYLANNDRYERHAIDYNSTIFHTKFSEHWAATYEMKDLSTAERFYRWIAGARMVADNWQTGWGPGTFYPAYKEYTVPSFATWVSDNPERSTVHNYFLLMLIEQGVPGFLLLLLLLAFGFYTVQKVYHRTADRFWRMAVCVSGVMLVQLCTVNFLSDLVETDEGGSLFYLCFATIIIADVKTRSSKFSPDI